MPRFGLDRCVRHGKIGSVTLAPMIIVEFKNDN
jgi:hypothetical protein